jgi:Ca-activated chloride channel family protein
VLFQFSFGAALLLLPVLLLYFWWLHRRTVTDMSPGRKRTALALRCLLATLLVLALAGMQKVKKSDSLAVVFLVDASKSVREDQHAGIQKYIADAARGMQSVDKVGVITFAQDPHTQSSPGQVLDPARLHDPGVTTATNLTQALRAARNELDTAAPGSGKRIVLLSDGNENVGHALTEVRELTADHIVLDTFTLPLTLKYEALIEKMVIPSRVKIGEPFPIRIVVNSLTAQDATVTLTRDGKPTGESRRVALHPGKNVIVFDQNIEKTGFFRYGATLEAPQDTIPENNKGEGFVLVKGKPTVLYVADSPTLTGFLQNALKSQNIDVQYAAPENLPANPADLQRFDSVFLSNVRAGDQISMAQMKALQVACRDFGVGFGMIGGENSFGAGGYRGTPIEDTLPITMDVKKQKRLPSVAVALVIEDLEIPTTINMSIEAAKATMDLLEPIDQVGVLDCQGYGGFGFGGGASSPSGTWRIPMQHVTDRESLKSAMQNLQNMGDPPSYDPFLLEAARVLNNTDAKVKHILFLGDGDAVYEASQGAIAANIKKVRDMGITVSTIITAADSQEYVKFMATIAYLGGGQALQADNPSQLPHLMLKDQETISQPPIIEEWFRPTPVEGEEVFKGIDWGSAPPLAAYNVSNLKPTAELSLLSHRQDPIFAGWRYGLGRAVAFMSDDRAKWAAQWVGWPGYAKFWAQTVRWTLRSFARSDYSTQVVMEGNRGHVIVDAIDDQGHYVNKLQLKARVAPPNTLGIVAPPSPEEPLRQTGPGHYEGWFEASQIGTYLVNVREKRTDGGPDTSTVIGLSTAYSPEYRDTQSNRYLMSQLARSGGGRADPPAAAVFGGERPGQVTPTDIVPTLLLLALLLLPFDIAVRRLAVGVEDFNRALAWLKSRRRQGGTLRTATPELSRLLDRKESVLASRQDRLGATEENGRAEAAPLPRSTPQTLRSERPSEAPIAAPVASVEEIAEPIAEEAGMSRLMAAKLRARQGREEGRGKREE